MAKQEPAAGDAALETVGPEQLAERFRDRLRVLAARRLGDWTLAEDAAQETLTRVLRALAEERLESMEALPAYVFQTARHVCQQWTDKRFRGDRAVQTFIREAPRTADEVALCRLITAERRTEVQRALEQLPPGDRELLRMLFHDAMEGPAAAARLGINAGALRVRKHRALRRLESLLGEDA